MFILLVFEIFKMISIQSEYEDFENLSIKPTYKINELVTFKIGISDVGDRIPKLLPAS